MAEQLVPVHGGVRAGDAAPRPPTVTYNFVQVHGATPTSHPVFVSPRLTHAQLAQDKPVSTPGRRGFEKGRMGWWSNYSGTYQPVAAFRAQAKLPADKFVPWQTLQLGGHAMQRPMLGERKPPGRPETMVAIKTEAKTHAPASKAPGRGLAPAATGGAKTAAVGGAKTTAAGNRAARRRRRHKPPETEASDDRRCDPGDLSRRPARHSNAGSAAAAASAGPLLPAHVAQPRSVQPQPPGGVMPHRPGPPLPAHVVQPRPAQPLAPGGAMPRQPGPPAPAFSAQSRTVQPQAQPKALGGAIPRQPGPPAPAHVVQPRSSHPQAPAGAVAVDAALLRPTGRPGQPLPDALQRKMEHAFAADFSGVRVHEGPQAEQIGAIAFTVGNDIWFAPGRFQPHTAAGQQLLGHELAHVL